MKTKRQVNLSVDELPTRWYNILADLPDPFPPYKDPEDGDSRLAKLPELMTKSVLVVAGEVSGDQHAAAVVRAIQDREPRISFFGIGGDALQSAGVEILHHVKDIPALKRDIEAALSHFGALRFGKIQSHSIRPGPLKSTFNLPFGPG